MCNYLFIAADQPLPTIEGNEEELEFYVTDADAGDVNAIRPWVIKPFVYDVGSHIGCACPYCFEPNWDDPTTEELQEWNENREDFRKLLAYLRSAIQLAGPVEVFNGWEYWLPPLEVRSVSIQDLMGEKFVFDERQLLTVSDS